MNIDVITSQEGQGMTVPAEAVERSRLRERKPIDRCQRSRESVLRIQSGHT
ncbi:MAG: hypothetical protein HW416_2781, partial [Chloroflexi bacterium]|nr:hypothetical protein [Chloroflexota bacterium]